MLFLLAQAAPVICSAILVFMGQVACQPLVAPSAAPTPVMTQPPFTPPPVPKTTSAPTSAPTPVALTGCLHFQQNPVCKPLPGNPAVSPHSAAWAALEFQSGRGSFGSGAGAVSGDFPFGSDSGPTTSVVIACDAAPWSAGQCNASHTNGITLAVPSGMIPATNSDHHYSFTSVGKNGEYDFWLAQAPGSPGSTMHVGGLGFCSWSGDGTNCSGSTATNLASSLGLGTPAEMLAAEQTPNGTFGHAIAAATLCADPSWVAPATYSDGTNTNSYAACSGHTGSGARPPEGIRWFLNYTDAQINAMNVPAFAKAFYRTLDKQHYGGIITDTTWNLGQGMNPQWQFGDYSKATGGADMSFPLGPIVLSRDVVFCVNGSC
jgi:hypothetical protein